MCSFSFFITSIPIFDFGLFKSYMLIGANCFGKRKSAEYSCCVSCFSSWKTEKKSGFVN